MLLRKKLLRQYNNFCSVWIPHFEPKEINSCSEVTEREPRAAADVTFRKTAEKLAKVLPLPPRTASLDWVPLDRENP